MKYHGPGTESISCTGTGTICNMCAEIVTGASAGIGFAIVEGLLQAGMNVIACARNPATLEDIKQTLPGSSGKLYPYKTNLQNEDELLALFKDIQTKFGHVDVLVNNAGACETSGLASQSTSDWRRMLDLNVLSTSICTRETLKLLEQDHIEDGHIIIMNSIAGHHNHALIASGSGFYSGTKHMLAALTKALHTELVQKKSKIRVTSISPGLVLSRGVKAHIEAGAFTEDFAALGALDCKDISDAVLYVVGAPNHVVISELTIVPNGQLM
ncbi:putative Dehydrogenase/reductase SDR family member 11 [Hypsibius exemplaris]|uniref:Dehydrogenase/reductase SDR family member 11 n=1 Tax=Hypsibius exemplaris TaxID=2072580 RepID=A0A1W0WUC0_HYPEX|nr:putative Dehydrogenase/reductase SDR family member 11 [Hypsibius exemplaris]